MYKRIAGQDRNNQMGIHNPHHDYVLVHDSSYHDASLRPTNFLR